MQAAGCLHPTRRLTMLALAGLAMTVRQAALAEPPMPAGHVVLTVDGKVRGSNHSARMDFDMQTLESFNQVEFETRTPWFDAPARFSGVPMQHILELVGAAGEMAIVRALNDYQSEIPVSDFAKYGVLLALKRDGAYMSVRNKGPLFIIYPFDTYPELHSSIYTSRCAWQVRRITIV